MKFIRRKIPTPTSLQNIALHYLGRYAASEASLRRILQNRLRRAAMDNPDFAADGEKQENLRCVIETIVAQHVKSGVLNDAAFADTKVNRLRREGRSRRAIAQKLAAKGLARHHIADALTRSEEDAEPEQVEFKAALALARRRKLGPFRQKQSDAEQARKDFAALARAGFSSAIARKALQKDIDEEWE